MSVFKPYYETHLHFKIWFILPLGSRKFIEDCNEYFELTQKKILKLFVPAGQLFDLPNFASVKGLDDHKGRFNS